MLNEQFTPAPWYVSKGTQPQIVCEKTGRTIALVYDNAENTKADANLMAASPAMFALLIDAVALLDHYASGRADNWDGSTRNATRVTIREIRAAIVSARGE